MPPRAAVLGLCAAASFALTIAGCGGSESTSATKARSTPTGVRARLVEAESGRVEAGPNGLLANVGAPGPKIHLRDGAPPRHLVIHDLQQGGGREARDERRVTIRYVGVRWDGETYSNTWGASRPPRFVLGRKQLTMPGFERGLIGMKAGGRREIVIPPNVRFPNGPPRRLLPSETLIYIVELTGVHDSS